MNGRPRLLRSRILQIVAGRIGRLAQPTRAKDQCHLDVTERKRNLAVLLRFTFRTSSVFVTRRFWCWRCGGWSSGSRRASRLKDPCGTPTKTGTDVVYRVSERYPPKASRIGDPTMFLEPSERIPIIRNPYSKKIQTNKFSFKTTVPHELRIFVVSIWRALLTRAWPVRWRPSLRWLLCPIRVRSQNACCSQLSRGCFPFATESLPSFREQFWLFRDPILVVNFILLESSPIYTSRAPSGFIQSPS